MATEQTSPDFGVRGGFPCGNPLSFALERILSLDPLQRVDRTARIALKRKEAPFWGFWLGGKDYQDNSPLQESVKYFLDKAKVRAYAWTRKGTALPKYKDAEAIQPKGGRAMKVLVVGGVLVTLLSGCKVYLEMHYESDPEPEREVISAMSHKQKRSKDSARVSSRVAFRPREVPMGVVSDPNLRKAVGLRLDAKVIQVTPCGLALAIDGNGRVLGLGVTTPVAMAAPACPYDSQQRLYPPGNAGGGAQEGSRLEQVEGVRATEGSNPLREQVHPEGGRQEFRIMGPLDEERFRQAVAAVMAELKAAQEAALAEGHGKT